MRVTETHREREREREKEGERGVTCARERMYEDLIS